MPARLSLFWLLYLLGSGVLLFSLLLTQVPREDRTFELIALPTAGALLTASLWVGFFWSKAPYGGASPGCIKPGLQVATCFEIFLAAYGAISVFTYRGP